MLMWTCYLLAHTSKTEQLMQSWGGSTSCSILQPIVPSACLVKFLYGKQPLLPPLLRKINLYRYVLSFNITLI